MNELYSELADVYEAMYSTFIDYKLEYGFYSNLLIKWNKKNVLEIGCGTGNLTQYFEKNGFKYLGLDLSQEMLNLATIKNPNSHFLKGDMRFYKLPQLVDSILITGRTISYMQTNEDVNLTFKNANSNLKKGGVFCFDFIDANRFISTIDESKVIIHEASYNETHYTRKSQWQLYLKYGMCFNWKSKYFKTQKNKLIEIGSDNSIVRTFTKDEIELLLILNDFKVEDIIDKDSYAFPTYVIIATKNK